MAADSPSRPRIDYPGVRPAISAMVALKRAVAEGPLEAALLDLVRLRASQLNGCAYCLDLHAHEARAGGEAQGRLDTLAAWRESGRFTDREQAALALTEAVTLLAGHGVPDAVLERAEHHFTASELPTLLYAIVEINAWNRLAVTARTPVPDRR